MPSHSPLHLRSGPHRKGCKHTQARGAMQGKFGAPHVMTEAFSASLRAREQNKVQTKKHYYLVAIFSPDPSISIRNILLFIIIILLCKKKILYKSETARNY